MSNAASIAQSLLQGQVGDPSVGAPFVGDAVHVVPQYPGRIGVPSPQAYYPGVGLPAVAAQSADPNGAAVQYSQMQYVAGDVTYLGFGTTSIPAGSVGTAVDVSTNRPFTPQKMGCPSTVLGLLITQVNVSGTNILSNAQGVPIELLSEVSTFPQVLWPSLDTATGVQFVVANPTAGALNFTGAFYGTQVRR